MDVGKNSAFGKIVPDARLARVAQVKFFDGLREMCPHHSSLAVLADYLNGSWASRKNNSVVSASRLIIPYHPLWRSARLSGVADEMYKVFLRELHGNSVFMKSSLGIAWSLAAPHLVSHFARPLNRSYRNDPNVGGRF